MLRIKRHLNDHYYFVLPCVISCSELTWQNEIVWCAPHRFKKYVLGDLPSAIESRILPEREKEFSKKSTDPVNALNVGMPEQFINGGDVDCNQILVSLKSDNSKQVHSPANHSELLS
ncbi:unnamed protein product [Brugia timori]|uniref:Uncharacterized protein n=1 Tax=Brugia timori TaxID=42155 RepID=A0A0R3RBL6_9BILA|nr:unnamed protein product [Brugia timori]